MQAADIETLRQVVAWRGSGVPVALATLVGTWGSAPRPPGALLAIAADGRFAGSVSGGCVEEDLVERVRAAFPSKPEMVSYGVTADQAARFGLPCGGKLRLVLEPVTGDWPAEVLAALEGRRRIGRRLVLATGEVELRHDAIAAEPVCDEQTLSCGYGPLRRLLIIGAGQLSGYLADFALALDFAVAVCDPCDGMAAAWDRPGTEFISGMPDDVVRAWRPDECSAVVALTHDPKIDDLALLEALKSDALYVGALGSRANDAKRRQRLAEFDLTAEQLARLHGPVGLAIGSRTPAEIAVAIAADLVAHHRRAVGH